MGDECGEVPNFFFFRLPDRHRIGGRGCFETDGKEYHFAFWVLARNFQRLGRGIDDAHIATARLHGEQVGRRAGHAQHVAVGNQNYFWPGGKFERLFDGFERRDAHWAPWSVNEFNIAGSNSSRP